jgi:hypothetical protein
LSYLKEQNKRTELLEIELEKVIESSLFLRLL